MVLRIQCVNGREIRFDFNDKRRARARCKHCTEYLVYVSKVGQTDTYRLNTLQPKHTCGRVFNKAIIEYRDKPIISLLEGI